MIAIVLNMSTGRNSNDLQIIRTLESCITTLKKIAYYRPKSRESAQDLAVFTKELIDDWKSFG